MEIQQLNQNPAIITLKSQLSYQKTMGMIYQNALKRIQNAGVLSSTYLYFQYTL